MSGTVGDKRCACEGINVFTMRDGLAARKDTYVDTQRLMTQMVMG